MNNIISSQCFICKKRSFIISIILFSALLVMGLGLIMSKTAGMFFSAFGMVAMIFAAAVTAGILTSGYTERIQMYEIMAGFRPSQIILGKTVVCVSLTLIFLAGTAVMCMIKGGGEQMLERLLLYWVIVLRSVLCIVFLSPLLKESTAAAMFDAMLIMACGNDPDALNRSPVSLFGYPQCFMMQYELTEGFAVKVIISAVIACTICYITGYITLKRKFDLEPHSLG